MQPTSLIHRYLLGDITEEDVLELERQLAENPELRREYVLAAATDAGLREVAIERGSEPSSTHVRRPSQIWMTRAIWVSIATAIAILMAFSPLFSTTKTIATLASSENAAWESSLPTTAGSKLGPGLLSLKSGVATIHFDSGAIVVLEAPAQLELMTPMQGKLLSGAAIIDVPESAIGFTVETPEGYVVDYGTQFAVRVGQQQSDFELIEGEIAVHHPQSGDVLRLSGERKSARIAEEVLAIVDAEEDDRELPETVIRVGTRRRTASVIRNNKRKKIYIDRDVLSVKQTNNALWDQHSFFSFDLTEIDLDQIESARLRLNQVPSYRGYASRLPTMNRFGIYGLTNPQKADWKVESLWEEAPGREDGVLLGTFQIPRSQQRGSFGIQNTELLDFLKQHQNGSVTLILVRETTQIEGTGPGMTHMFASASHPEAVGPTLEFTLTK